MMDGMTAGAAGKARKPKHADHWTAKDGMTSLVRPARPSRPSVLGAMPQPVELDLARTALVVVDMQNDFCHPEGWFPAVRGVDPTPLLAPVAAINRLIAASRAASVPILWLNWGVRADAANLPPHVLDKATACGELPGYGDPSPTGHGPILAEGSWGAATIDVLDQQSDDLVVHKHRLSGFKDSTLDSVLRRAGITTLLFTGINIDRCVFATLTDASFEGYDVILVEDATATPSPDYVREAVLYLTRLLYGFTTSATEVEACLALGADNKTATPEQNGGSL